MIQFTLIGKSQSGYLVTDQDTATRLLPFNCPSGFPESRPFTALNDCEFRRTLLEY